MRRFWDVARDRARARPGGHRAGRGARGAAGQGAVDRRHQPGRLPARRRALRRGAAKRADLVICQDAYFPTETARARARAAARRAVAGEGRHDDELRAPREPRPARARPARRGAAGLGDLRPRRPRARAPRGVPVAHARPRCTPSTSQLTEGRLCDQTGISHARLQRDGPLQWPCPSAEHPGTERLYGARRFSHARRPRAPRPDAAHRARRRGHARLPARPDHGPRRAAVAHDDPHRQVAVAAGGRAAPVPRAAPGRRGRLRGRREGARALAARLGDPARADQRRGAARRRLRAVPLGRAAPGGRARARSTP